MERGEHKHLASRLFQVLILLVSVVTIFAFVLSKFRQPVSPEMTLQGLSFHL